MDGGGWEERSEEVEERKFIAGRHGRRDCELGLACSQLTSKFVFTVRRLDHDGSLSVATEISELRSTLSLGAEAAFTFTAPTTMVSRPTHDRRSPVPTHPRRLSISHSPQARQNLAGLLL